MLNLECKLILKGYEKIFLISVLFFLAGFVVTTVANIILSIIYGEFGYDNYVYLMTILSSVLILVQRLNSMKIPFKKQFQNIFTTTINNL